MAVYQFLLIVIPRKGVIEKFGIIPDKLEIDYKERTEYYHLKKASLIEENEKFKDVLLQQWWNSTEIQPIEIIHQIDKLIKRANYSKDSFINWKYYTSDVDNDASLSINQETGKIEEVRFRADLREQNLQFLKDMIHISDKYEWMLMDMNGNLVNPEIKEVAKLIKDSNAYRFLKDPLKFFDDIDNGTINIE